MAAAANQKRTRQGAVRRRTSSQGGSDRSRLTPWRWYAAGVMTGVFLSLLLYLGTLPPASPPSPETEAGVAQAPEPAARPRFDFYTVLPEQTIDVDVEPATVSQPREPADSETWLLQAGSFRQQEDADRRRAELLLLGLAPRIESSEDTGTGRWHRVYLGPFTSHGEVSRVRGLTAAQDIDTLLLKRGQP